MRVLILYNEPILANSHPDADSEYEIHDTVEEVHKNLLEAGHDVRQLGVCRDPSVLLNGLNQEQPEVVFNLFEGQAGPYATEVPVAGIFEWLGVPSTGCPVHT